MSDRALELFIGVALGLAVGAFSGFTFSPHLDLGRVRTVHAPAAKLGNHSTASQVKAAFDGAPAQTDPQSGCPVYTNGSDWAVLLCTR